MRATSPFGRDRLGAGLCVALVHALIGYALLMGLTGRAVPHPDEPLKSFFVHEVPPPAPRPPHRESRKTASRSGAASPRNLRAVPVEIVAPPPVIPLIQPPPIIAPPRPALGTASSAGASDRPGPGAGSGGVGNGSGRGLYGEGDGSGDGDGEGDGTPPRWVRGKLGNADYPRALGEAGIGGTVAVRYRVGVDGRVTGCAVTGSSGNAELDALTCRLIEERFRFRPSRDADGRPVPAIIVENHSWIPDRSPDPEGRP